MPVEMRVERLGLALVARIARMIQAHQPAARSVAPLVSYRQTIGVGA